jgi:hypothetical protein
MRKALYGLHARGLLRAALATSTVLLLAALWAGVAAAHPGGVSPRVSSAEGPSSTLRSPVAVEASDIDADQFGISVAIQGDIALVGAPYRDIGDNVDQGAVYVYVHSGGQWLQQGPPLSPADGSANDHFGTSIALDGDTLLVGAPGTSGGQGSAYVFVRTVDGWSQEGQALRPQGAGAGDAFGSCVALSGSSALIGAPRYPVAGQGGPGAAFVFVRAGGTWVQQGGPLIAGSELTPQSGYATSLALDGDTAAVGAGGYDTAGVDKSGAVYVFTRSGGAWSRSGPPLAADIPAFWAEFGASVALSGDTLAVSQCASLGPAAERQVFVFVRTGGAFAREGAPLGLPDDYPGLLTRVVLDGDTLLSSETGDSHYIAPFVFPYVRTGGVWQRLDGLVPGTPSGAAFGSALDVAGDAAIVGAPATRSLVAGAAHIYARSHGVWTREASLGLDYDPPSTLAAQLPVAGRAGWNNSAVTITLTASAASGIDFTEYRELGAQGWTKYEGPLKVRAQGVSTYEYRSRDLAGNVEAAKRVTVSIDGRKPRIRAYRSVVRRGARAALAFRITDPLPTCGQASVKVTIASGGRVVKTIRARRLTCNARTTLHWRCRLPAGTYQISVGATDIAGNRQRRPGRATLTVL